MLSSFMSLRSFLYNKKALLDIGKGLKFLRFVVRYETATLPMAHIHMSIIMVRIIELFATWFFIT